VPTGASIVDVHTTGRIGSDEVDCIRAMIGAVLVRHQHADTVRVRVSGAMCSDGPALLQVNLRVCGAPARIQVPGRRLADAVAAAAARLDRQLRRLTTAWQPWPWPDPERRSLGLPGEGRVARLKSYRLQVGMPCQAAAVMGAMDYDVHLFTDAETGEDAVVYRAGPTGVRLARQRTMRPPAMPATLALTINPRRTATLTPAQAAHRLAEHHLPWLFFTDIASGRGHLLYRRYDGDLGLLGPVLAGGDGGDLR
jgi:hypothetical protein